MIYLTIYSSEISKDICDLLQITPGRKFEDGRFPELKDDELKWSFLRGVFDGDDNIVDINKSKSPIIL